MENFKKSKVIKKVLGKFDKKQAKEGFETEHEHAGTVKGNKKMMAGIARDHLKEDPRYYTHLKKMENKYNK